MVDDELSIELNNPLQVRATRGMHGALGFILATMLNVDWRNIGDQALGNPYGCTSRRVMIADSLLQGSDQTVSAAVSPCFISSMPYRQSRQGDEKGADSPLLRLFSQIVNSSEARYRD